MAEGSLQDAAFVARVNELRGSGERVVLALTGADNDPQELGCQRKLVSEGSDWVIKDID